MLINVCRSGAKSLSGSPQKDKFPTTFKQNLIKNKLVLTRSFYACISITWKSDRSKELRSPWRVSAPAAGTATCAMTASPASLPGLPSRSICKTLEIKPTGSTDSGQDTPLQGRVGNPGTLSPHHTQAWRLWSHSQPFQQKQPENKLGKICRLLTL